MLKSMTGFGSASAEYQNLGLTVEIKTLNSKNLDTSFRLPKRYSGKEQEIRKLLADHLERGKVVVSLDVVSADTDDQQQVSFNKEVITAYYTELAALADQLNANKDDLMRTVLSLPNAVNSAKKEELDEAEWKAIESTVMEAIDKCKAFRANEGEQLQNKLVGYVDNIDGLLKEVVKLDPKRIAHIEERIKSTFEEKKLAKDLDPGRLEQEMIYYIEKLDIEEEKTRLTSHIRFFHETIGSGNKQVGKKLGFISQEMGREINTIGSKANDAGIQRLVVEMKEELEKIKEQMLNVL